jgi:hypothetical protein
MGLDYLHDLRGETMGADRVARQEYLVDIPGELGNRAFEAVRVAVDVRQEPDPQLSS